MMNRAQLIEVKNKDGVLASYSYDEDGKRIKRQQPMERSTIIMMETNSFFETDDANNITAEYLGMTKEIRLL